MVVEAASSEHSLCVSSGHDIGLSVLALIIADHTLLKSLKIPKTPFEKASAINFGNQRLNEIQKQKTLMLSNQSQNIEIKENMTRIKISQFNK